MRKKTFKDVLFKAGFKKTFIKYFLYQSQQYKYTLLVKESGKIDISTLSMAKRPHKGFI